MAFHQLPLSFIPNRGQVDKRVKFYSLSGSASFFFARDEVVYSFVQREKEASLRKVGRSVPEGDSVHGHGEEGSPAGPGLALPEGQLRWHVVRLRFVGANPDPIIEGGEKLAGKVNYFVGSDPARWKSNLSTYGQVRYREKELPVVGACVIINATVYGRGGAPGLRGNAICRYMGRHWRQSISCDKLLP